MLQITRKTPFEKNIRGEAARGTSTGADPPWGHEEPRNILLLLELPLGEFKTARKYRSSLWSGLTQVLDTQHIV